MTNALSDLYTPAPAGVPPDLTVPSRRYRIQVIVVLVCLLVFVLAYLALIAGAGYLAYLSITYPWVDIPRGRGAAVYIGARLGLIAAAVMLFLFLLKGLFKRQQPDETLHVEITEEAQPRLFAYLRALCDETQAPRPYRVYVSPEVNAAVFYETSLLSLVLPVRKNLLIGLGLVNVLNLSEFKAVLAHEFGHFSQSSMKLGSYVYVANRIIADMVYGRDYWDQWLDVWKAQDLRVSFFAWVLFGVVWIIRKILGGVFSLINFTNAALSRQMEFHADKVAVSVTGSDALIHALSRLDFASEALGTAVDQLRSAAHHHLYTDDLFRHQTEAMAFLRQQRQQPNLGEPPPLPSDPNTPNKVFTPEDVGTPQMWASHPSNFDREQSAKTPYIRGREDGRSPWQLFDQVDELKATVTAKFNKVVFEVDRLHTPATAAETVHRFIQQEQAEMQQNPRYHGFYDDRFIEPGDLDQIIEEVARAPWSEEQLAAAYTAAFGPELAQRMAEFTQRRGDFFTLVRLKTGDLSLKGKTFTLRDREYRLADVDDLLQSTDRELEGIAEQLKQTDRTIFTTHYQMAEQLNPELSAALVERYRFQLGVEKLIREMNQQRGKLEGVLGFMANKQGGLDAGEFNEIRGFFVEACDTIDKMLAAAEPMQLPALASIEAGTSLREFLFPEGRVVHFNAWHEGKDNQIDGKWIGQFLAQCGKIDERMKRVAAKNLGKLVALQEHIATAWYAQTGRPMPERPEPPRDAKTPSTEP